MSAIADTSKLADACGTSTNLLEDIGVRSV